MFKTYRLMDHSFSFWAGTDYTGPAEGVMHLLDQLWYGSLTGEQSGFGDEESSIPYPFPGRDFRRLGPVVWERLFDDYVLYWRWSNPSLFHVEALTRMDNFSIERLVAHLNEFVVMVSLEMTTRPWLRGFLLRDGDSHNLLIGHRSEASDAWIEEKVQRGALIQAFGRVPLDPLNECFLSYLAPAKANGGFSSFDQVAGHLCFPACEDEDSDLRIRTFCQDRETIIRCDQGQGLLHLMAQHSNLTRLPNHFAAVHQWLGRDADQLLPQG